MTFGILICSGNQQVLVLLLCMLMAGSVIFNLIRGFHNI